MAAIHKTGDAFPLVLAVKLDLPNGANCQSLCALHSATPVCESKTSGEKKSHLFNHLYNQTKLSFFYVM